MAPSRGPVSELLVPVDAASGATLREQLEQSLRAAVRSGRLGPGTRLPSSRGLAAELGISRGVVTGAYAQLVAEGYLVTRQGAPVRVSDAIHAASARPAARPLTTTLPYDLRPGRPALDRFPREPWLRALARGWRRAPLDALGDLDPRGVPALRDTLAAYLDRARATASDPEHMIVCSGLREALALTCRSLAERGIDRIAVEDPGRHEARLVAEECGLQAVPIPVDDDGLDVAALEASGVIAVVVTPAHQFPTGAVLSRSRRAALVEWAERNEALVIEDDPDAELRFSGTAVGALQGLAAERVLYVGSADERLAPGLRLGWMLVPSWLTWPLVSARSVERGGGEVPGQLALGELIDSGELDRHLRRMRGLYAERRAALHAALAGHLPEVTAVEDPAGLHDLVRLPDGVDEGALLARAARHGVALEGVSWHRQGAAGPPAVLMGYGALAPAALREAVRRVAAALA
jgi:GntR family transcriptional regulator/MocR family aminotransferase